MFKFFKNNWIYIVLVVIIWFFTFYITLNKKPDETIQTDSTPSIKTDSSIIVVDTILRLIDKKKVDEINLKKEKLVVEQQLKDERLNNSAPPKQIEVPKIIFERKEVIVEKKVEALDPEIGHQILENFKIRNENMYLKQQISRKDSLLFRDSLSVNQKTD